MSSTKFGKFSHYFFKLFSAALSPLLETKGLAVSQPRFSLGFGMKMTLTYLQGHRLFLLWLC